MNYKTLRVTEETYALVNKARVKYVRDNPQAKVNYDVVLEDALNKYIEG